MNNFELPAAVSKLLREEGETPQNTLEDVERLVELTRKYRSKAEGYKRSYISVRTDAKRYRAGQLPERSRREVEALIDKPSIILASLPKSGTKYIGSTLAKTLGYEHGRSFYVGEFPKYVVRHEVATVFAQGGLVADGHLQADWFNLRQLKQTGLTRIVLHVRDPRATLYSWLRYAPSKAGILQKLPGFLRMNESERIDQLIDGFFSDSLHWLNEWADAIEADCGVDIHVTTHDQLVNDETALFNSIFDFYGLSPEHLETAPKDSRSNFRAGLPDEWRDSISEAQIGRMTSMIPERLFAMFGWRP